MPATLPFDRANFNSSIAFCDTSFVGNLLCFNGNTNLQKECEDVLLSMRCGKTTAAISCITSMELSQMYLRSTMSSALGNDSYTQQNVKNMRQFDSLSYIRASQEAADAWKDAEKLLFSTNPFWGELVGNVDERVMKLAHELRLKYHLPGTSDAVHLALAISEHANYFLTTDSDFCTVNEPDLQIYVDRQTYEKNC